MPAPVLSQGSALAFLGMNLGCNLSWGNRGVVLGTPVANNPTVPIQLNWEWKDTGPGENQSFS